MGIVLIQSVQSEEGYALLDYAVNRLDCQMSLVPNPDSSFWPKDIQGGQTQNLYSPNQCLILGRCIRPIILNGVNSC